jgi:hypothetical protein
MQLLSFFSDQDCLNEYSDRDIPSIPAMLTSPEGMEIFAKVNFKCKDIGLFLTETSSNADWRYPIDEPNQTSLINLQQMNNEENSDKGLYLRKEDNSIEWFNSTNGSTIGNKLFLSEPDVIVEEGDVIKFYLHFVPNPTVSANKRLFAGITSHGTLVD